MDPPALGFATVELNTTVRLAAIVAVDKSTKASFVEEVRTVLVLMAEVEPIIVLAVMVTKEIG